MTFVDATTPRRLALAAAVELLSPLGEADPGRVTATAQALFAWLVGPAFLEITPGEITNQATGQPTGATHAGGTMQLHDNEQVTLAVAEADAKGVALQDTLTWTVDDATVAALQVAGDTQSALLVAGLPGSTVVTVTDGALSATLAVDVVPSGVATVTITPGAVETQPTA